MSLFYISDEWSTDGTKLYYSYQDSYDGQELWDESDITWIYYTPLQIVIETDSGVLILSRLAKNYAGLTCRSFENEYTHPIKTNWKKLIKFLIKHT